MSEANKSTTNQLLIYDVVVVGAGPAGMTASIYASRYKLSNLVIGKVLGGELSLAHKVCNIPGFIDIPGIELGEKWKEQVEGLGAEVVLKEVQKIELLDSLSSDHAEVGNQDFCVRQSPAKQDNLSIKSQAQGCKQAHSKNLITSPRVHSHSPRDSFRFRIIVDEKETYYSKALIVATGSERRRLDVPGEKEYLGRGVSYCTTCDGAFFKDRIVAVAGGADAAVTAGIHLSDHAKKVYLIYRGEALRAEPVWVEEWKKIEQSGKGETILNTNVKQILGGQELKEFRIKNDELRMKIKNLELEKRNTVVGVALDKPYKGEEVLLVDGLFVEIGGVPGTSLIQTIGVKLDESGHAVVNEEMKTNIPGLFCAGDMTDKSKVLKQAVTAMAQGAIASASVYKFIKNESAPQIRGV